MNLLFVLLMSSAHGGWWSNFCGKFLVAEDPWPFAKHSTAALMEIYERTNSAGALKELSFRWYSGLLDGNQIVRLIEIEDSNTNLRRSNERRND